MRGVRGILLSAPVVAALFSLSLLRAQDPSLDFHGHIAYVGADNNIYLLDPRSGSDIALTNDAGNERRYEWPTWSSDGRLAHFSTTIVNNGQFVFEAHVTTFDATQPTTQQVYEGISEVFNYAYWAPSNCESGATCRDLAILLSSLEKGMFVELVRVTDEADMESHTLLGGPPFYYSWSPDGSQMLWHRRVANRQQLDVFNVAEKGIRQTLPYSPGLMNTPGWSPVDDRLLVAVRGSTRAQSNLAVITHDEINVLVEELNGLVSFEWSPDGTKVAYRTAAQREYGPLYVLDATTGEVLSRSPGAGVIAFFWSPDSEQIAYVTLATPPGSFNANAATSGVLAAVMQPDLGLAWSVLHVSSGTTDRFGGFFPTDAMGYLLTYFDQFAQSHRIWSPDSRHLIYSEMGRSGPVISLLDTSRPDSVPFSVKEGLIGIWSYN